ncbi:putative E3 ubiquitin-protein ligase [Coemansia sp. RSA 2704]|nr:putative E3 ubiquitin-protein ligase [Coemansia sp. RSA 2704]
MVTGECFCCNSKVSYPEGVACFKCTVCDTINDLRVEERGSRVPPPLTLARLRAGVQAYRRHPEKHGLLEAMIRESFGQWEVLNFSFASGEEVTDEDPGVQFADVHAAYKIVMGLAHYEDLFISNLFSLWMRRPLARREDIRYLLIILENPLLQQQSFRQEASYHHHIVKRVAGSLAHLPNSVHESLVRWLAQQGRSGLKRKVQLVHQFIAYRVQKYERAKRRRNEGVSRGLPMTTYSAQSTQRELPAFQRTRSSTNAAAGRGRHTRMRSNTDSRISLSGPESSGGQRRRQEPGGSAFGGDVADARAGLGIANLRIGDTPARFASLGAGQFSEAVRMDQIAGDGVHADQIAGDAVQQEGRTREPSYFVRLQTGDDDGSTGDLQQQQQQQQQTQHQRRARSSSEAPARAARRAGGGVDVDDYFVGADGVFYPRGGRLALHQHDWRLLAAAKAMALLHAANQLQPARARLGVDAFGSAAVDGMDLVADYDAWQARVPGAFAFCGYPILLSLRAKAQIMQVDAARQMDTKLKEAVISALFRSGTRAQPHLKLLVRRHCLAADSLHQLAAHEQDLKKRLRIEFAGEEGVDGGGLTKEWFMLLTRELLNPAYGMFTQDEGRAHWFNPAALETGNQYFLVGVVVGLALYNSTILDLQLPLAVFKKLLRPGAYQSLGVCPQQGASQGLSQGLGQGSSQALALLTPSAQLRAQLSEMLGDVAQFRPQLARGLRQLLQYRGADVEHVFCLTFEAAYDAFGARVAVPLVPGGAHMAVTSHNRVEYVQRYLHWVLTDSVARQFEPFRRGFYYVCGSNALSLFAPEEIELLVHGSGRDWAASDLRAVTDHAGFDSPAGRQLCEWFWALVAEMTAAERRQLLMFVTGSDRMPTPSQLHQFRVKLVLLGNESARLPVAHTCFNQLGLWAYRTKDELGTKLMMAITESEGFGLK